MKQSEKRQISRDEIIYAAIHEIAKAKSKDYSLNEVCRANNISKGRLYHYFSSKEELFYASINKVLFNLAEHVNEYQNAPHTESTLDYLHNYYLGQLDYWMSRLDEYDVTYFVLDSFTDNDIAYIRDNADYYNRSIMTLYMQSLTKGGLKEEADLNSLYSVILLIQKHMFMFNIKKIIEAVKSGNAELTERRRNQLINFHDNLLYTMLFGIQKN